MERKLTCIVCPLGCELTVTLEENQVTDVMGYTCPRGKRYAEKECVDPRRTVTSTVRCADGGLVSVKTDREISKNAIFSCMEQLSRIVAQTPIVVGDVIAEDVCGSNIVATQNKV